MPLLVAYSFDQGSGTSVLDASGNGHDLPLPATGPPNWDAAGHTNGGISDNGTSGTGVACGLPEADYRTWLPVGGAITSMCWARLHTDTSAILISCGVDSGFSGNFCLYYLSGTGMGLYMSVGGTTYNATDAGFVPDDVWHHWAATCDGTSLRLYLDGVQIAITNPPGFPEFADHGNFMIGLAYPVFNGIGMDGVLDDVRIYDVALTAAEITTCMGVDVATSPDPLSSVEVDITIDTELAGLSANANITRTIQPQVEVELAPPSAAATLKRTVYLSAATELGGVEPEIAFIAPPIPPDFIDLSPELWQYGIPVFPPPDPPTVWWAVGFR